MPGFGEKLKGIRESHGATIEDISRATKIHPSYLEAVERDDIEVLPGPAYVKFYIRAYADVLGFDPSALIKEYDLELAAMEPQEIVEEVAPSHEWKEALRKSREEASTKRLEALQAEEVEPEPEEPVVKEAEPERPEYPRRRWRLLAAAFVASTVLSLVVWGYMACFGNAATHGDDGGEGFVVEASLPAPREVPDEQPQQVVREEPQVIPGPLSVTDFGVGRRVVGHRLEGLDDSFTEGEVVWFATRVLGGKPGDVVRHVWLRNGGRVQVVDLKLGGSHWRTRSKKTLWGVGEWAVEARDPEGRVLARAEFVCE